MTSHITSNLAAPWQRARERSARTCCCSRFCKRDEAAAGPSRFCERVTYGEVQDKIQSRQDWRVWFCWAQNVRYFSGTKASYNAEVSCNRQLPA